MLLRAVTLTNLVRDHRRIETSTYWASRRDASAETAWADAIRNLVLVDQGSLLAPIANVGISVAMVPQRAVMAGQLKICRQAMEFRPRPDVIAKCAVLESWMGDKGASARLLQEARVAYAGVIERWPP
jgi:hypothetical protein